MSEEPSSPGEHKETMSNTTPPRSPESSTSPSKSKQEERRASVSNTLSYHDSTVVHALHQAAKLEQADKASDDPRKLTIPPSTSQYSLTENLYDPATGSILGVFAPVEHEDTMWTQLAQIRDMQAEIATMHLQMEGITSAGERMRPTREDSYDDPGSADPTVSSMEQREKRAKDAEFARLEEKFAKKKESIDALMGKLATLSQSVKSFHKLRKPVLSLPTDDIDKRSGEVSPNSPTSLITSQGMPTLTEHHGEL